MVLEILVTLAVLAVLVLLIKRRLSHEHHNRLPRGFSRRKFVEDTRKHEIGPNRDGYSTKKVPADLDAVVIGSGIGGLACAALMSRAGKRVLVLEQHYIAGGCTHAFEEHGYEFDTGIHYIGNIEKRKKYLRLITRPGDEIEWDQMGRHEWDEGGAAAKTYDEIRIGTSGDGSGKEEEIHVNLRAGADQYIAEMCARFPGDENRAAIERWVRLCQDVSQKDLFFDLKVSQHNWLSRLINAFASSKFFSYTRKTALEMAQEVVPGNTALQAALLGQFGDYGLVPSKESFFIHASVANHYFNGGFYPRGGSTVIANKIIPVIEKAGGRCLVRQAVGAILLDKGAGGVERAVGVEMENGDRIMAPQVISACGVFNTYKKLLPSHAVPPGIVSKIDRIGTSCTMMYLFVGMKGTPSELKLRSSNIWHWPEADYDKMLDKFMEDPHNAPIPMFLGFPCAKDSTWEERFPGRSNSVILTMADYRWFEKWGSTSWPNKADDKAGKRETGTDGATQADYDAFKEMFEKRILEEGLYKYYPQTRGKVDFTMVGSSLTFNYYLRSHRGEVYGLESHPERFQADDWLRARSAVPGLYMTGQDVTTLGVTGALMSGIITAHATLGYGGIDDLLSGRNLVEDIWHLEERERAREAKNAKKTN